MSHDVTGILSDSLKMIRASVWAALLCKWITRKIT